MAGDAERKGMRAAALMDHDSALGFRAAGARVFVCPDPDAAGQALDYIYSDEHRHHYAVIFIQEELAMALPDRIETLRERHFMPIITVVPGKDGSSGHQERLIRKTIETAVGFDVLGNRDG